jgi:hypothetical protein
MTRTGIAVVLVLSVFSVGMGFGGFGGKASFVDFEGLNRRLTRLNRGDPPDEGWGGSDAFRLEPPLFWLSGHGAGFAGDFTIGGGGALTARQDRADSVFAEFGAGTGFFEVGYCYSPIQYFWVRPCAELSGAAWTSYVHSRESFNEPNFSRWFLGWGIGAMPALELMGRLPYGYRKYAGLYLKGGYFLPLMKTQWYGDEPPHDFDLEGWSIEAGIRFGRTPPRSMRI